MSTIEERLNALEQKVDKHHPPSVFDTKMVVIAERGVNLRNYPGGPVQVAIPHGEEVMISSEQDIHNDMVWVHTEWSKGPIVYVGWCALDLLHPPEKDLHQYDTEVLAQKYRIAYLRQDVPNRVTDEFWGGGVSYPATVRLRRGETSDVQISRLAMSRAMLQYLVDLNRAISYESVINATKIESGIFNGQDQFDPFHLSRLDEDNLPKNEYICSAGNYIAVKEEKPTSVRPVLFRRFAIPPTLNNLNFKNGMLVIHHLLAMHKELDYYVDISSGTDTPQTCVFPLTEPENVDGWIKRKDEYCDDRVVFLPDPDDLLLTPKWNIPIRTSPDVLGSNRTGLVLARGKTFRIKHYYPTYNGLWARIDDGYACLGYQPYPGRPNVAWSTDFNFGDNLWAPIRPRSAM